MKADHCIHEVSKGIIKDGKLMLEVNYEVFADCGRGLGLSWSAVRHTLTLPSPSRICSSYNSR
jgi:hypothetical protein